MAVVVQERRGAGGQQYRPLAAVSNRRADGITQAGTETAEVLVPDHVMRLGLQEGPGEDHGAAAVARVDRVLRHRLGRFDDPLGRVHATALRSEEHTSELQSLMRISYAVFCLKNKNNTHI